MTMGNSMRIAATILIGMLLGGCVACGQENNGALPVAADTSATPEETSKPQTSPSTRQNETPEPVPSTSESPTDSPTDLPVDSVSSTPEPSISPSATATADSDDPTRVGNTYYNVRYQYALDLPDGYDWQSESSNGDGRHFNSSQIPVAISVWGSYNQPICNSAVCSPEQYEQQLKAQYPVSYSVTMGDIVVASWNDGNTIFYQRNIVTDEVIRTVQFSYDSGNRDTGDQIINQVATTLRAV